MNTSVALLGVLVFWLAVFATVNGENRDEEVKPQAEDEHHFYHKSRQVHHRQHESAHRNSQEKHHSGRHHKGLKARNANSSVCITICDLELAAVAGWFNNTKELRLLFQLIPPSVKKLIFEKINGSFVNASDPNSNTTFNGSLSVNLNLLYDATVDWPILTFFAKLIGFFLSRARGLLELFNIFPEFANIWKIILHALSGGSVNAEILISNLKDLFGFNGTVSGNLFNFTYWEQFFSPSKLIRGFEHAIEGGLENIANLTNLIP